MNKRNSKFQQPEKDPSFKKRRGKKFNLQRINKTPDSSARIFKASNLGYFLDVGFWNFWSAIFGIIPALSHAMASLTKPGVISGWKTIASGVGRALVQRVSGGKSSEMGQLCPG